MFEENFDDNVPVKPIPLMIAVYKKVFPIVHEQLGYWKQRAAQIPNPELRKQALASIETKQFHCEGGGIYALLATTEKMETVLHFIVAYQTISDYLDNLCDRSISQDGDNFRALHQSMVDAVTGKESSMNYYQLQEDQDDGGYLVDLVRTCQRTLSSLVSYPAYQENVQTLCQLYCDLQVYKHIALEKREEALLSWWDLHKEKFPGLEWYEFAAATGSTLGIFYYAALSSHAFHSEELHQRVFEAYFPYMQGLHILLDYLIDQGEDREGGDLNFCFYYPSEEIKLHRFEWIVEQARRTVAELPFSRFHLMVAEGLLGLYLADQKVKKQADVLPISRKLLKRRKPSTWFFYFNGWLIHRKGEKV